MNVNIPIGLSFVIKMKQHKITENYLHSQCIYVGWFLAPGLWTCLADILSAQALLPVRCWSILCLKYLSKANNKVLERRQY